jgi:hypothetical protein
MAPRTIPMCIECERCDALNSNIVPENPCDGELIPPEEAPTYLHFVRCSSCGTEFTFEPDSDWVTVVLPGMRN